MILKNLVSFVRSLAAQRFLIFSLAKREVNTQYRGSILGFLWTIINPLILICVFWFVFSVGFKAQPLGNVPFVVWLTAGLSIWMFFSESVLGSTEVIIQNSQLIKKTLFKPEILPIVKILSSLLTHGIFVVILVCLIYIEELPFSWFYAQFFYYLFATSVLALGLAWLTSALTVFVRDVGKITAVLMQIGFWSTPIFWDVNIMDSAKVRSLLKLNPMHYIVQGYRDSFIYFVPFWERELETLYFWGFAIALLLLGGVIFNRLKPHFADVL